MKPTTHITLRVLARLLSYPAPELRDALPELLTALRRERALRGERVAELIAFARQLAAADPYEAEARYVDTFDRGRATSLHLFEHVHGDSRERGPALADLQQTYERAGLQLEPGELPDYLPAVLEFASMQPVRTAREFLGETAHILNAIFSALLKRESPYASVIAAVLELAGERVQAVPVAEEPALDEAWAEPPAFGGCSTNGQSKPGTPQPIQIVRTSVTKRPAPQASQGVQA
ncbi:MAG: nitrate reductase molybdenum cofactor assembly chaperone [Burkholderiaceae bacterium]|nr:nitrate reductase molybdenum cofactor assembly chaperone [Burkholderiaceae bacterium]